MMFHIKIGNTNGIEENEKKIKYRYVTKVYFFLRLCLFSLYSAPHQIIRLSLASNFYNYVIF